MNNMQEIEQLLEKYWEGETSIQEEQKLKQYFQQTNIANHLKKYQSQFVYFKDKKNEIQEEEDLINNQKEWEKFTQIIGNKTPIKKKFNFSIKIWIGMAASITLLAIGFGLGRLSNSSSQENLANHQKNDLKNEIKELKQAVMESMKNNTSPSDRLQAVKYASQIKTNDKKDVENIVNSLAETLLNDENTNVRLASANALLGYKDEYPKVTQILVDALGKQDDPVVQIALINSLLALKVKEAKKPIEKILETPEMPEEVKQNIKNQLKNI